MDIQEQVKTDEQREVRNKVERNGWNRNQKHRNVAFNPYRTSYGVLVNLDRLTY